jgi:hypothetical protein
MKTTVSAWDDAGTDYNGRHWTKRQVGWYVVDQPTDDSGYGEYAADYWTTTVPAGRYPIYALRVCGQPWHSLSVKMPGKPREHYLTPYPHSLAQAILEGEAHHVELLPGVEAREVPYEYEGKSEMTYGIFADGENIAR